MAKAKSGCLGWIIIAGAFIAWISGGRDDRPIVTSVSTGTNSTVVGSSLEPSSPASQAKPKPSVDLDVTREASVLSTPQAITRPTDQSPSRAMSTTANVRLRASEAADAPVVATLRKGTAVEVVGSTGNRVQVSVPSLNLKGWVHRNYLTDADPTWRSAPAFLATEQEAPKPATPKATPKVSKPAPGTPIRDPVSGSCDCPYDYARNGSLCGGRSAYSRPGGRDPICYY